MAASAVLTVLRLAINLVYMFITCCIQGESNRKRGKNVFILVLTSGVLPLCRQYVFKRQDYNKPFFSTFTKTSMFVLYLLGFLLWRPWRQQCTGSIKRRHSAFVSVQAEQTVAIRGHCASTFTRRPEFEVPRFQGFSLEAYGFLFLSPPHPPTRPAPIPQPAVCWYWGIFGAVYHRHYGKKLLGMDWHCRKNMCFLLISNYVYTFDIVRNVYCFTLNHLSTLCDVWH